MPKIFLHLLFTEDLGDSFIDWPKNDSPYFNDRDIERNDKNLVATVRGLGEKANGRFSELKIVEIPDGTDYEIDEYDGMESIEEKHQSWG
jgi:hypothetical protein